MNGNGDLRPEELLTVSQVARRLHLHPNTVRLWSNQGLLRAYRVGPRRDRRFRPEEIQRFLSESDRRDNAH